jgi:hypothetical protein
MDTPDNDTWFVARRIEWILEIVEIFGYINREHICKKFGVSTPQASYDITKVMDRHPGFMAYNAHKKRYEKK